MKNVIFIVSPFFGGASRMTINIANLLDRNNFNIIFLVYAPKMEEIRNYLPEGCLAECLQIKNIWDFATIKLYNIFRKYKVDYVFSSFTFINIRVAIAGKMYGTKVILRSSNYLKNFTFVEKTLMKLAYPYADIIVTQNKEMQDELQQFLPSIRAKIIYLHNIFAKDAIEQNIKENTPYTNPDEIRYVWMGRVTRTKGYDILLKAFYIVKQEIPNAHLYLLGKYEENSFYHELTSYLQDNNIGDCVHFLGLVSNPHKWVKHAHCFVLPSRLEGLPNALIEAMYIGIPVVATRCIPIIDRMVSNGQNGFTVPVEDPQAMALAMRRALSLKNCKMTYQPSSDEDFKKLFE